MKAPTTFRVEVIITPLWEVPSDSIEESLERLAFGEGFAVEENRFRDLIKGMLSMLTERPSNG